MADCDRQFATPSEHGQRHHLDAIDAKLRSLPDGALREALERFL
jgi:hypothetical protein